MERAIDEQFERKLDIFGQKISLVKDISKQLNQQYDQSYDAEAMSLSNSISKEAPIFQRLVICVPSFTSMLPKGADPQTGLTQ